MGRTVSLSDRWASPWLLFLCLILPRAVEGFVPTTRFESCARPRPSVVGVPLSPPSHAGGTTPQSSSALYSRPDNKKEDDNILPDPLARFLASDLFAIVVASELVGLLDSVNDPTWQGWFSPVSGVPETITILLVRFSVLALLWITPNAAAGKLLPKEEDDDDAIIPTALQAGAVFSVFRILLGLAIGGDDYLPLALRDCYLVTLSTTAFRFLYAQYFW